MTQTPFDIPNGLNADDTIFAAPGAWANSSLIRFWEGAWQIKGGWQAFALNPFPSVCRSVFSWQSTTGLLDVAFGCADSLWIWQGGQMRNMTPPGPGPAIPLNAPAGGPLATTSGSATVTFTITAHALAVGQLFSITGLASPVNGIFPNGTWNVASIVDANHVTAVAPNTASATGSGGGLTGTAQAVGFTPGANDGSGGAGYGTGQYGQNSAYGQVTPLGVGFPMSWSLSSYGGNLVACPRGQAIYMWEQDFTTPTLPRLLGQASGNAPPSVTYALVVPQRQVMAFGCTEETSGQYNPLCIRWSDIENPDNWNTLPSNNAGEFILEGGGGIVTARICGDYVFVWTTTSVYLGTFVGDPSQTWKFERQGFNCGAISPGSPLVQGQNTMWLSPDRQFWQMSLGGAPSMIACPVRSLFADHIAMGQADKIVGGKTSTYSEMTWWWPDDRDGLECSRSVTVNPEGWATDLLPRSAYVDAGPQPYPIGVAPYGLAYYHETGQSADGQPLIGFIESAAFYLGEAAGNIMVRGVWPDFKLQNCDLNLTVMLREFPQAVERVYGPWTLSPGTLKRSLRLQGRIARVRYDFAAAPAYARSGKQEFDVEQIGGR